MLRHRRRFFVGVCLLVAVGGCSRPAEQPPARPSADAQVRALADAYLDGFFERYPDAVTLFGVPGRHHDKLPDNSLDAVKAWQAREDAWLAQAKQIDTTAIE